MMDSMGHGWTEGPGGRAEGKELGFHPKKKRSKWEPDYDAADRRMIVIGVVAFLVVCVSIGAIAVFVRWALR